MTAACPSLNSGRSPWYLTSERVSWMYRYHSCRAPGKKLEFFLYFEYLRVAWETRSSTSLHFERRCFVCGLPQELVLAGQPAKTLSCPKVSTLLFQSEKKLRFFTLFGFRRHLFFLFGLRSPRFQIKCSACRLLVRSSAWLVSVCHWYNYTTFYCTF